MLDLRESMGLAYLFIAHDLRLVEHISDRVAVMYLGRIVETAPAADLYRRPLHPYTRALMESTPTARPGEPTAPALDGEQPSPTSPPSGCRFHPRCPVAEPECSQEEPLLVDCGLGRSVACLLATEDRDPENDAGANNGTSRG
jgi:oligopeptide/dipeptide ABC transporter ATP-binding protein